MYMQISISCKNARTFRVMFVGAVVINVVSAIVVVLILFCCCYCFDRCYCCFCCSNCRYSDCRRRRVTAKKGPIVLPAGFDDENETSSDAGGNKIKEFPSRFSPQEKSVRKVISKSLGTMAIMIVVIVLVGICLLDIPCERFCGDDKKSSNSPSSGGYS